MIKKLRDEGIQSLSFKQLNRYLQNANQEMVDSELVSLMFDEDPRLQTMIEDISPDGIKLKIKNQNQTNKQPPTPTPEPQPPSQPPAPAPTL